jgi:hypothetical protein
MGQWYTCPMSLQSSMVSLIPNPAKPEPKGLCCHMDEFPGNPPPVKGGEGGFLKFLANLGANSFLRE